MFHFLLVGGILSLTYAPTLPEIILLLSFISLRSRLRAIDFLLRCSMSNIRLVQSYREKQRNMKIYLNIKAKVHHIAIHYNIFLTL